MEDGFSGLAELRCAAGLPPAATLRRRCSRVCLALRCPLSLLRSRSLGRRCSLSGLGSADSAQRTRLSGLAASSLASSLDAKALLVFTTTGSAAQRMARLKPGVPILAVTPSPDVARALTLSAYVYPALLDPAVVATERSSTFYKLLEAGLALAHKKHLVSDPRDRIVATAGLPFNTPGCANAIRVIEAGGLDCWGGH